MTELVQIIQAFGAAPATLTGMFLFWQIIKTDFGKALVNKFLNGHDKNGVPRTDLAGQASVDFWKQANREIVSSVIHEHEDDSDRRHAEVKDMFDKIETLHREAINAFHNGANRIVDAVNALGRQH